MRKLIVLVVLSIMSTSIYSQSAANAKALLDEVAEKVQTYNNISIEFDHKLDNSVANVHQQTRGDITLKGDLYHFSYMGTEQLFDGKKVYLIIHEDEEVIIQKPSATEDNALTPSKIFSFYKKGFSYKMDELKTIKGVKIQYVKLIPIDSKSDIASILVGVDIRTKHLFNIIETGKNKTTTTLEIRTFKTNQPISNNLFIFDTVKYKNQKKYTISEPK